MIKKILLLLLVLPLILSCSYSSTDFYIINKTDLPIEVEYKVSGFSKSGPFVKEAFILKLDSDFEQIGEQSTENVTIDIENNTVHAKLESGESLWFGEELNFSLSNEPDKRMLTEKIEFLKITIEEGVLYANKLNIVTSLKTFNHQNVGISLE